MNQDLHKLYEMKRSIRDLPYELYEKLQNMAYQEFQKENLEKENEIKRQADFDFHSQRFHNLRHYLLCLRNVKAISNWTCKRAMKKIRKQALEKGIQFS